MRPTGSFSVVMMWRDRGDYIAEGKVGTRIAVVVVMVRIGSKDMTDNIDKGIAVSNCACTNRVYSCIVSLGSRCLYKVRLEFCFVCVRLECECRDQSRKK